MQLLARLSQKNNFPKMLFSRGDRRGAATRRKICKGATHAPGVSRLIISRGDRNDRLARLLLGKKFPYQVYAGI
jgi:hypothetical protein